MRLIFLFLLFCLSGCQSLSLGKGGDFTVSKPVRIDSVNSSFSGPDRVSKKSLKVSPQSSLSLSPSRPSWNNDLHTIAIENMVLGDALKVVLRDTLGLTVQYNEAPLSEDDPLPLVSIETSKGVSSPVLFRLFENAVRDYGYYISLNGNVAVVQKRDFVGLSASAGGGFKIYQAKYLTSDKLFQLATPLISDRVRIVSEPSSNIIVVSGSSFDVDGVISLFRKFDDGLIQSSYFGIYPLQSGDVKTVVDALNSVLSFGGVDGVQLVPLVSYRSVLVVSKTSDLLERIEGYIKQVDAYSVSNEPKRYVWRLKSLEASEVVRLLESVFRSGDASYDLVRQGVSGTSKDSEEEGSKSSRNDDNRSVSRSRSSYEPVFYAEKQTNSLVAYVNRDDWLSVIQLISQVDRKPVSVQIDAQVVEVVLNSELRHGVQYSLSSGGLTGLLTRAVDGSVSAQVPGAGLSLVGGYGTLVVDALSSVTDVHTLSSPSLIVEAGGNARLSVGDQVPVSKQISEPLEEGGASRLVTNVELKDTGIVLNVTPFVDANKEIRLDISMQISQAVVNTTSGIDTPVFQQRSVKTKVSVSSEETLVIGGLRSVRRDRSDSGVPVIKDVPVFGSLFSTDKREGIETELLLLVTPIIHEDRASRYEYSNDRFLRYEKAVKEFYERGQV